MRRKKLKKSQLAFIGLISIVSSIGGCFFISDFANSSLMFASRTFNELIGSPEASAVEDIVSSFKVINKEAGDAIANDFGEESSNSTSDSSNSGSAFSENGNGNSFSENQENIQERIPAKAIRVVDGDTYILEIDGVETRVRLIGVDTPESVAPSTYRKDNTEEGKTVSEIVKDKIKAGDTLYIEYDVGKTDKYDRTLAYVYFEDGTMVQDWLLKNGYANVATYQPNVKYADHFVELAHTAAENKVGLWDGFFEEK